ncbi:POK18 protein, partial [Ifrita kowaldi]|nr:POK18 protein [Ifrita kowaldi]
AQKLLGTINWLCPYLGLTIAQLSPLFNILAGHSDLNSPRHITPEAQQALDKVQQSISNCQVYHVDPDIDVAVFVVISEFHPTGIIAQWSDHWSPDPLHIL